MSNQLNQPFNPYLLQTYYTHIHYKVRLPSTTLINDEINRLRYPLKIRNHQRWLSLPSYITYTLPPYVIIIIDKSSQTPIYSSLYLTINRYLLTLQATTFVNYLSLYYHLNFLSLFLDKGSSVSYA